jgi:hypothetical protein
VKEERRDIDTMSKKLNLFSSAGFVCRVITFRCLRDRLRFAQSWLSVAEGGKGPPIMYAQNWLL